MTSTLSALPGAAHRQAWLAALASLVLPGLGQWRNGQFDKAAWWLLGFGLLAVPGVAVVALWVPPAGMLPLLLAALLATLALWVWGAVDAWRVARRIHPAALAGAPWRSVGVTLLLLLLCDGLALPLLTLAVRTHLVASFRIPSASMAPTLWPGDIVFADRRYACIGCATPVRRGDVVIFAYPNDRTRYYVKRAIALPGDRVRVDGGRISVNGQALPPPDADAPPAAALAAAHPMPPQDVPASLDLVVPPGQVFVLGDATGASVDSRQFGGVPLADVVGRVRQVWWSAGPDGVRWSRLGRVIR